jgi:hypothetical protein
MSSLDDNCVDCALTDKVGNNYVDPTGTELDGATWIQDSESWFVNDAGYRIWEEDLNQTGTDAIIGSLFVSYDDDLQIKSQGNVLFDSKDYDITAPWTQVIDVIDLVGEPLLVAGNGRLNFWVKNSENFATGVIWKGTSNIPEPGTLALLSLGLLGLGAARRRKA